MFNFLKIFKRNSNDKKTEEVKEEKPVESLKELVNVPEKEVETGCVTRKLSEPQKAHVAKLLGEFVKPAEIVKKMKELYNLDLTVGAINHYKNHNGKKWKKMIMEARSHYLSRLEDVPGYHKRVRMDRMEKAVSASAEKGDIKTLINATEHQRKEVEGGDEKLSSLTVYLQQLNIMGDEELQRELENTKDYIMKLEKKKNVVEIEESK